MTLYSQSKTPTTRKLSACIQCDICGHYYPAHIALKHEHEDSN